MQDDFLKHAADLMDIPPDSLSGDDNSYNAPDFLDTPATPPATEVPPEDKPEPIDNQEPPKDTTPPKETSPSNDTDPGVSDDPMAVIAMLRQQVMELSQQAGVNRQIFPEVEKKEVPPTEGVPSDVPVPQVPEMTAETIANYLSEDELDRIIDEPQLVNVAISRAQQEMFQVMVSKLPDIVSEMVQRQATVSRAVQLFYEQNDDLRPYSDFVRFKMKSIEDANRNMTYQEIFDKTAEECRKGLGLQKPKTSGNIDATSGTKPAFSSGKKASVTRPTTDGKKPIFDENARDLLDDLYKT